MKPDKVTYGNYLKVEELLSLQKPLSEPQAHDEMLFIVIHQVYELWFKQVLFEMRSLVTQIENDNPIACFRGLERICTIFKTLIQQLDVLETMTPVEFNQFRSKLNPASGFQSRQFRQLELLSGGKPSDYDSVMALNPEWSDEITKQAKYTSLRQAFLELLVRQKLAADESSEEILKGIYTIYHEPKHAALYNLCEQLLSFDEQLALWRFRHVQMVERMIGQKRGTGGSLGVKYLESTLSKRFFSELWESRTQMTAKDSAY